MNYHQGDSFSTMESRAEVRLLALTLIFGLASWLVLSRLLRITQPLMLDHIKDENELDEIYSLENNTGDDDQHVSKYVREIKASRDPLELDLRHNNLGNEGAIELAQAIKESLNTVTLDLGRNRIGVQGARALADAIIKSRNSVTLNLRRNNIGIEGGKAFAVAIKESKMPVILQLLSLIHI